MGNVASSTADAVKDTGNFIKDVFEDVTGLAGGAVEVMKKIGELLLLADDFILILVKAGKLFLAKIPQLVVLGIRTIGSLLPALLDLLDLAVSLLDKYKEPALILTMLTPIIWMITFLIDIILSL